MFQVSEVRWTQVECIFLDSAGLLGAGEVAGLRESELLLGDRTALRIVGLLGCTVDDKDAPTEVVGLSGQFSLTEGELNL